VRPTHGWIADGVTRFVTILDEEYPALLRGFARLRRFLCLRGT